MSFLPSLLLGVALGFSLAAPPGPMNAWIAAASIRSVRSGVVTGLGAMTADLILGSLVYALYSTVDLAPVIRVAYLLGGAVIAFYGVRLLQRSRTPPPDLVTGPGDFVRALGLGVSNPFQIVWWLTAGVAFAYLGGVVLFLGLFGAIGIWIVAFPLAVRAGTRRFPTLERAIPLASAALLFFFAAYVELLAAIG